MSEGENMYPQECQKVAREGDYDRYLITLFMPKEVQRSYFTLIAFFQEVIRIPDRVQEPMIGYIRLAWWREALEEIAQNQTIRDHAVVHEVTRLLQEEPELMPLLTKMLDGVEWKLENETISNMDTLKRFIDSTTGNLCRAIEQTENPQSLAANEAFSLMGVIRGTRFSEEWGRGYMPQTSSEAKLISEIEPAQTLKPENPYGQLLHTVTQIYLRRYQRNVLLEGLGIGAMLKLWLAARRARP